MEDTQKRPIDIPKIGFGSFNCKNTEEIVYNCIKEGIRLIDTASSYKNEVEVGKGIKRAISEGIVKREDLFIVTKTFVHERKEALNSLKESLKRLDLEYVDLFLDHWPTCFSYLEDTPYKKENMCPMHKVWEQMEKAVELKLTKYIGVSNYNIQSLCNLPSFCKIKPAVNEVEFHPYLYQKNLKFVCDKEEIRMLAYCPLFRGGKEIFEEKLIQEMAAKYKKTPGQIILNWHLKIGVIPIPGTSKVERIKENIGALDFDLSEEDVTKICGLHKGARICPHELKLGGLDIFG